MIRGGNVGSIVGLPEILGKWGKSFVAYFAATEGQNAKSSTHTLVMNQV